MTLVTDRTARPSKLPTICASSSSESPTRDSLSTPRSSNTRSAAALSLSAMNTLATENLPEPPVQPGCEFFEIGAFYSRPAPDP